MDTQTINPWTWQDAFGFAQAQVVTGAGRTIYCAGQASVDGEGNPLHEGDMVAQAEQALANVETVLRESGAGLGDVVRLTYYVTDVEAFFPALEAIGRRLDAAGRRPAATLVGVTRLALPALAVEIEATAVTA